MQADIKCLECGKMTRNVELGRLFYLVEKPSENVIIKDSLICPKCKKEVSNKRFLLKTNDFLMKLVAANISSMGGGHAPLHLKGANAVSKEDYEKIRNHCKSKPIMVEKF